MEVWIVYQSETSLDTYYAQYGVARRLVCVCASLELAIRELKEEINDFRCDEEEDPKVISSDMSVVLDYGVAGAYYYYIEKVKVLTA